MSETSHEVVPPEGVAALPCFGVVAFVDGKYVDAKDAGLLPARNDKLIAAASECVLRANDCIQQCIVLSGQGDRKLAACAESAMQLAAVCSALEQMVAAESRHLSRLVRVVKEMCKDCERQCRKLDKHPECKACGKACAALYKECDLHLIRALFA